MKKPTKWEQSYARELLAVAPVGSWIAGIAVRLRDELPYGEDNKIIVDVIKSAILANPDLLGRFVGTHIIEEDHFEELGE